MGVFATYCQLCGLPLQHDHYVREAGGSMLKIYRGSSGGSEHIWAPGEEVFKFGPEHAWLEDTVGLPLDDGPLLRGRVEDGDLIDAKTGVESFVADGIEEHIAFHARCWEMMGSPKTAEEAIRGIETPGWSIVEPYQAQLFAFSKFRDDGHGALLADPAGSSESRDRIAGIIEKARADT